MSGEKVFYRCVNCGECCERLLIDRQGVRKGLPLLPDERELFRESQIKPGIGIGENPGDKGFKVISYQMTENACPHRRLGGCTVWASRPTVCRAYPFMPTITQGGLVIKQYDLLCNALRGLTERVPGESVHFEPRSVAREMEAAEELSKVTLRAMENLDKAWFYDLETESWVPFRSLLGTI